MTNKTQAPDAQPVVPMDNFKARGVLASSLKCWHRLDTIEAAELVALFQNLNAAQPVIAPAQPVDFDDWPEFHESGMGCGLEDRGITDRYEAMRYGWDEAIEQVGQRINRFETTPQPVIAKQGGAA